MLNVRQFSGALVAAEAPAGTATLIAAITLAAQNTRCLVIFFILLISCVLVALVNHISRMPPEAVPHNGHADPSPKGAPIPSFCCMKRHSIATAVGLLLLALPGHVAQAVQFPTNGQQLITRASIEMPKPISRGGFTNADAICPPTTDSLFTYNYLSYITVTNHGGKYDSGASFSYDYTRRCKVSPITSIVIRDNFGVTEQKSSLYGRYENTYRDVSVSNCWEIARISAYGQSEWSNKVCYNAPAVQTVSVPGIYMYLNSEGQMDGNVYINWTKGSDSAGLRWTACPSSDTWQPSDPGWTYEQSSYALDGQTIFTGHITNGPRCMLVSAKNSNGILSAPFRVEYTFAKQMAQPYSASPSYVPPLPSRRDFDSGSSNFSSLSQDCVGICYGVPSKLNGLPRNTYVSGYFRKDGTYVRPYTRSK